MNKTWRNLALTTALAAAVFSCSRGGGENDAASDGGSETGAETSDAPRPTANDAPERTPVPDSIPAQIGARLPEGVTPEPAPQAELDRSEPADTATGVVEQYFARLISGDFEGAYLLCDPKSPNSKALRDLSEGLEDARQDAGDQMYNVSKNLFINVVKNTEWEKIIEDDEHAVFLFWKAGDEPVDDPSDPNRFEVWRIDGVWRVTPPKSGMPLVN